VVAEGKGEREGALYDKRHVRPARIQRHIVSQSYSEIQIMSLLTGAIRVRLVSFFPIHCTLGPAEGGNVGAGGGSAGNCASSAPR
jgi:hypothetical protein